MQLKRPILYNLIPYIQNYDWGNTNKNSFARNFLMKSNTIPLNYDLPIAEIWKGAHNKGSSRLKPIPSKIYNQNYSTFIENEQDLNTLIKVDPEFFLGKSLVKKNIKNLPFLFKILDAEKPLSIQAHPDKKLAEYLRKKDPKNYPDDNHKPELAISLGNFHAIVGFRPIKEIIEFIKTYNLENYFLDILNNSNNIDFIKNFYKEIMYLSEEKIEEINNSILNFLNTNSPDKQRDPWFYKLIDFYGKRDPGILCLYLFNYFHLKKNEAIFLGPNIPHAYLKGEILECMSDSDNVVRGGLTNKFKDIETLISMLDYNNSNINPIFPEIYKNLYKYYNTPIKDFIVKILHEPHIVEYQSKIILNDFPSILTIINGKINISLKVNYFIEEIQKQEGEIIFFPGILNDNKIKIEISFSEDSLVYLASTLL